MVKLCVFLLSFPLFLMQKRKPYTRFIYYLQRYALKNIRNKKISLKILKTQQAFS